MLRRRLARTDLHLSAIGLGCWTLGGTWWGPDQDDVRAVATIRAAVDAGVNWVDTAPSTATASRIGWWRPPWQIGRMCWSAPR